MAASKAVQIADEIAASNGHGDPAYYYSEILQRSRDETIDSGVREALVVIGHIASFNFKHGDTHEPFGPMFQLEGRRSAVVDDLTDENIDSLYAIQEQLTTHALRARIQDVIWLCRKDLSFAVLAIDSYIKAAETHFNLESWTYSAECAERAIRVASLLRKKDPEPGNNVARVLQQWIETHIDQDRKFVTARAIRLLNEFGYGNPAELCTFASRAATVAESASDYHRAEEYWKQSVASARRAKDETRANECQSSLANCYANNARSKATSKIAAASIMLQSIEAYKRVPGSKSTVESLYEELAVMQKESMSEMGSFKHSIDISEIVKHTEESIRGESLRDDLVALCFSLHKPVNYQALETQARELAKQFPLSHMFGGVHVDQEGRVIAKSPGMFESENEVPNREIYRLAAMEHHLAVFGVILPAVEMLKLRHRISEQEMYEIVENNPFISPGQEPLYARGLLAGVNGDYVVSASLLVPMIENSLRHVLNMSGVRITTLNTHNIQESIRIQAILTNPKTLEIFGENIVRELSGLLVERTYGNLRNIISHGLGDHGSFYQPHVVYFWWLVLRLCLTPIVARKKPEERLGE